MKMDQQTGNVVTQFFAWLAAIAGALGWTTQDLVYIIFGFVGVSISLISFVLGRLDARAKRREESKRTQLMARYIEVSMTKPATDRPASMKVINETINRMEEV